MSSDDQVHQPAPWNTKKSVDVDPDVISHYCRTFSCPHCRGELVSRSESLECTGCGHLVSVSEGFLQFTDAQSTHGEFSADEMQEFLKIARESGWRAAIERYAKPRNSRVVDLIADPRRRLSLEPLESGVNGRVLDFGCGYGGISMLLASMFDEVVALDGSQQRVGFLNIVRNQEDLGNIIPTCHNDPTSLPFPDCSFDAITLIGVLEYLPLGLDDLNPTESQARCLREFLRVLRPGGRLLLHTKNRFGWQFLLGAADHSLIRFAPVLPRKIADAISRRLYDRPYRIISHSKRGYQRLLDEAGFVQQKYYWPIPGYQKPRSIIAMNDDLCRQLGATGRQSFGLVKMSILRALCFLGLLAHIVPNFGILAFKPQTQREG
jgi:SAM-dependent methyltransferase